MKYLFFAAVSIVLSATAIGQSSMRIIISTTPDEPVINRNIYGQFSEHLGRCIYDGYWVSDTSTLPRKDRIRLDVVEALKKIKIPNLRWPGGCFADNYYWMDGIGDRSKRPKMVNSMWGNVTEDNSFGTN